MLTVTPRRVARLWIILSSARKATGYARYGPKVQTGPRDWPCNSNSVCLGSCRLPDPGVRSTDCGLSAGILAAGPDR